MELQTLLITQQKQQLQQMQNQITSIPFNSQQLFPQQAANGMPALIPPPTTTPPNMAFPNPQDFNYLYQQNFPFHGVPGSMPYFNGNSYMPQFYPNNQGLFNPLHPQFQATSLLGTLPKGYN
jgi:hypothetical protein